MPDYIYLLENRLSADQQSALRQLREAAREAGTILFLAGDAVRELTSGHVVRALEVAIHGNALDLKAAIAERGGAIWGEDYASGALYLCFPGTVRVDLISTRRVEYPQPGKPVYHPASIQEYLRQRDFTINAMGISLNEGSYGLLMDPANGAADIESQTLRLVSNYGFLEEPSLLIRATRYLARLGWEMDPKTRTRYANAKEEGVIEYLSAQARRQELEQIGHEEEGLKVLQALEAEGWMEVLFPSWTSAKADEAGLTALHELAVELLLQGVHADMSAGQMRMLTARLAPKDLAALKKLMLRPGFVEEWNSLDAMAAGFAKVLLAEENVTPSVSYKLFTSYDPEAVLWLGFTTKDETVKERFNLFLKVWPEIRQRIPHSLLQEMRITDQLPAYREIVQSIFLELLDGRLTTTEEARAFLEPHSPPAPPPKETIKRPRAKRGEAKMKEDSFDDDEEAEDTLDDEEDLDDIVGDDDDLDLALNLPKVDLDVDLIGDSEAAADEEEDEEEVEEAALPKAAHQAALKAESVKRVPKAPTDSRSAVPSIPAAVGAEKPTAAPSRSQPAAAKERPPAPKSVLTAAKKTVSAPKSVSRPAPGKAIPAPVKKAAPPAKTLPAKAAAKAPAKAAPMPPAKSASKPPVKSLAKAPAANSAPQKKHSVPASGSKAGKAGKPSQPAVKKTAAKPGKKR